MLTERLRETLVEAEAELQAVEGRAAHLRQLVESVRALLAAETTPAVEMRAESALTTSDDAAGLDAGAAFKQALQQYEGPATMSDLWPKIAELLRPGYSAPRNAVNTAARRLADDPNEPVHRSQDGRYEWVNIIATGSVGATSLSTHVDPDAPARPQPMESVNGHREGSPITL